MMDKTRTWRITVVECRNPRRQIVDVVEAPDDLEPQAVKEAHMMKLEDVFNMRLRCIKIEEVKANFDN